MSLYDLTKWVEQEDNPMDRKFREAVHVILYAISHCRDIYTEMIMKGAVLLAIRYHCIRYTTDIDFSTSRQASSFDRDKFLSDLQDSLIVAAEALDYGLDCRVQSAKFKPASPEASFPTLKIKIGYADKQDRNSHKRLLAGNCSTVVEIDYSFNEATDVVENIELKNGGILRVYSVTDLIAEKYRAILQQRVRNRYRRQDVFDLYYLFDTLPAGINTDEKRRILNSLRKKAAARGLAVSPDSMADPETIRRSKHEYHYLKAEIIGDLPEFDIAYQTVQSFYESLPWNEI